MAVSQSRKSLRRLRSRRLRSLIFRCISINRKSFILVISVLVFMVVSSVFQALRPLVQLSSDSGKHPITLWTPLTDEELTNFTSSSRLTHDPCNSPFQHCCIGQCRQAQYALNERDAMYKFNGRSTPFASFSDVLDYYYNHHLEEKTKKSCNIVFVGDSLSSDHAMGATCHLIGSGYNLTSCNNAPFGLELYGSDVNVTCKTNLYPNFGHHTLEKEEASFCPKVTIGFLDIRVSAIDTIREEAKEIHEEGGLIVFNWGVHCNDKNKDCLFEKLSSSILPVVKGDKASQYSQWKFLYRETEPQHFNGPGGLYHVESRRKKLSCSANEVDNWRNDAVQEFMSLHNLTQEIPTIEIFKSLSTLYQLHHSPDCTHYCYNPARLDVTWDSMLRVLSIERDVVATLPGAREIE